MAEEPDHSMLGKMRAKDINEGSLLEITLFENSEWYDGWTRAPTVNPQGYDAPENKTDKPGRKICGFVAKLPDQHGKLTLVHACLNNKPVYEGQGFYVDFDAIHSYRRA